VVVVPVKFVARVQKLGRIAIPKPLRDVLGVEKGDLVQVSVRKIEKPPSQEVVG